MSDDETTENVEEPETAPEAAETQDAAKAAEPEAAAGSTEAEPKPKTKRTRRKAAAKAQEPAEPEAEAPAEPKAKAPAKATTPAKAKARAETPARRRDVATPAGERPVVRAHAKYVRSSARKARMVCDHLRGKDVVQARAILAMAPRAVAGDWSKLLESAVANAEHNHELIGEDLRIKDVFADEGPTLKRFQPRAMGRATKIRKRTSHLTITLTPKE